MTNFSLDYLQIAFEKLHEKILRIERKFEGS